MRTILFAAMLLGLGTPAAAQWFEASTPRVRVYAVGEQQARNVAERLERLDAALRLTRGQEAQDHGPAARLTVYIVNSTDQIARMAGPNVRGFYRGRAGGSVAFVPSRNASAGADLSSEQVLFHEYAHHFMYRNFAGAYPSWLSEGFAEFYATARVDRDGAITLGYAPDYRGAGILLGQQLPIERLLEPGVRPLTMEQRDNLYGRGWMLTHYLTFSGERRGQLDRYIDSLRRGMASVEAARAAFGDLAMLDRELNRYAMRKLSGLRIPADRLKLPPVAARRLSAAEQAMIAVHIESVSGVNDAEARRLLPRARRSAAPHEANPFAQGVLAEAEFDAGNFEAARDAATRAVAADAKSRQGLVYQGMALSAIAEKAKDTTPATYRAVIAPWQRANRLDPDDPLPVLLIYQAANRFGQRNKSVIDAILYAQQLAPEDRGLRMIAAHEYLQRGDTKLARPLVASLVYDPHAANRERMAQALTLIDADNAKGAMAALSRDEAASPEAEKDGTAGD